VDRVVVSCVEEVAGTCHRGTRLRAGLGGSAAERALLFGVSGRFGQTC
jgi:hypothetical protein